MTFIDSKTSMSVKKQISGLNQLCTIYEEVPESFLDGTDFDSYFYHSILDIALIGHRIARVSKGSNESFCFQTNSVLQLEKTTKIPS